MAKGFSECCKCAYRNSIGHCGDCHVHGQKGRPSGYRKGREVFVHATSSGGYYTIRPEVEAVKSDYRQLTREAERRSTYKEAERRRRG